MRKRNSVLFRVNGIVKLTTVISNFTTKNFSNLYVFTFFVMYVNYDAKPNFYFGLLFSVVLHF